MHQLNFTSADGKQIVVSKKAIQHLQAHAADKAWVFKTLERLIVGDRTFVKEAVEFGEQIGFSSCVQTSDADEIVFAQRIKRPGWTRFVKSRQPAPCSTVTLILRLRDGALHLVTGYIGGLAEKELSDPSLTEFERPAAEMFWGSHALIWDPAVIKRPFVPAQKMAA